VRRQRKQPSWSVYSIVAYTEGGDHTVGGRIATGRNGALCKRTRDPRETHAGGRHQDMIILCGIIM
jgi:hypothetical protein